MRSASVSEVRLFGSVMATAAAPAAPAMVIPGLSDRTPAAITPALVAMAMDMRSAVWLVERPGRSGADLVAHLRHDLEELVGTRATLELGYDDRLDARRATLLIPGEVCLTLLRILQEATRNALTHGHATRIQITLAIDETWVRALVVDDGHGSAGSPLVGKGGLVNMRARATRLGGEVVYTPGEAGMRVAVHLPWRPLSGELPLPRRSAARTTPASPCRCPCRARWTASRAVPLPTSRTCWPGSSCPLTHSANGDGVVSSDERPGFGSVGSQK